MALDGPLGSLTYAQLHERSDRVASGLIGAGVMPGAIVGLLLDRSPEAIVALLGILKAGAAYLPLDRAQPAERISFVLKDAQAAAVIVPDEVVLPGDVMATRLDMTTLLASEHAATLPRVDGNALAYVMYTSGPG